MTGNETKLAVICVVTYYASLVLNPNIYRLKICTYAFLNNENTINFCVPIRGTNRFYFISKSVKHGSSWSGHFTLWHGKNVQ